MHDPVMIELKRRLATADAVDVGRYQFLNMDKVRQAAGAHWPQLRERVFVAARSIIERRAAEDDVVVPCASGFLVIYTALTGDPAAQLTEKIRLEMERFFLGDEALSAIEAHGESERLSIEAFRAALAAADPTGDVSELEIRRPERPETIALSDLTFQAAWDARREAVSSFFVKARTTIERDSRWRPDLTSQLGRADDRLAFDLKVLDHAAAALDPILEKGARCALIVPAGFANLSQPRTRSAYVTALAALPRQKRQLIWTCIQDAPSDAPASTLTETGRIILTYAPHLFILAPLKAASLERYAGAGASWIGAGLPRSVTKSVRDDIDSFVAKARRMKTPVFLDRCDDWEAARTASRHGAGLLTGRATGVFDAPIAPFKLSRSRLLANAA